ncbi:MAG: hypothetical protein JWN98_1615 [Abditibacteriota bacterium]|nr:hypothetical protein [Abditibacteriota bacterium]
MSSLKVSENRRFLTRADGTPFFFLGDTAWELFHRLNREEAEFYLRTRAAQGYTVIQAVVLAEFDGLGVANAYGDLPLENNDPTKPQSKYFEHVDWIVNKAAELGLHIGMLPTWGDKWNKKWGQGPEIFTPENAQTYGAWLGRRYRDKPIIWILGGDRPVENENHFAIIRAMARGIKQGDGGTHLITFHPQGGQGSSQPFHNDEWLDFNMWQSGHHSKDLANYNMIARDYNRTPIKPVLDAEPRYEDHPVMRKEDYEANRWFDEYDVRKAAYWSLFAGAFGHTYGCHDIWQFWDKTRPVVNRVRTPWKQAILLPGAVQMGHARKLLESRPLLSRVPDQSLIVSGQGEGGTHVQATRDEKGTFAMIYVPNGQAIEVDTSKLSGARLRAWWFNPRDGKAQAAGEDAKAELRRWTPPAATVANGNGGNGNDWVLVLDDAAKEFAAPGA